MEQKRAEDRQKKRIKVKFGDGSKMRLGFTEDLSPNGFFISTPFAHRPGSLLTVELEPEGAGKVTVEASVQWTKSVPASMVRMGAKGGMGMKVVRFLEGAEIYRQLARS